MDFIEYLYYESLPYFYAGLSYFALSHHDTSKVAGLAGVILAFCSYQVFMQRYNYRVKNQGRIPALSTRRI
jgi:hypothetical protein